MPSVADLLIYQSNKMTFLPTLRSLAVTAVASFALLAPLPAFAATLTTSQIFTGSKDNRVTRSLGVSLGTGVLTNTDNFGVFDLVLPQHQAQRFDTSLGDLLSVQIIYSGAFTSSFDNRFQVLSFTCRDTGLNPACENSSLSGSFSVDYGVFSQIGSVDEVSTNRTVDFNNQNAAGLPTGDLFAETTLTSTSDLAAYSGSGTYDLTAFFFADLDVTISCDPNLLTIIDRCDASYRGSYGAEYQIEVVYTYDDGQTPAPNVVPIPAGAPLILTGLGLFGWLRRRPA